MSLPGMRTEVTGRMPRHVAASHRPQTTGRSSRPQTTSSLYVQPKRNPTFDKYFGGRYNERRGMRQRDLAWRKKLAPDMSFDLDGNGFVSQREYFISKHFDKDGDGKLNRREKSAALEAIKRGDFDDHPRDYFDYENENARRKKCTVMTNLMRKTRKVQRLSLQDTHNRTMHHDSNQVWQRPMYTSTASDANLGELSREAAQGARTRLLMTRRRDDITYAERKEAEHQQKMDEERRTINGILGRVYREERPTRPAWLKGTQREFFAERRQKLYMDGLEHVAKKEGIMSSPMTAASGYTSAVTNLPESISCEGLTTSINRNRFPSGAYRESKATGEKIIREKRKQKSYEVTRERMFPGSTNYQTRHGYNSTMNDFFKTSFQGFVPDDGKDPWVRKMPMAPNKTAPLSLSKTDPYKEARKTLSQEATSRKYTHIDYVSIGRQMQSRSRNETTASRPQTSLDMRPRAVIEEASRPQSAFPAQPQSHGSPLARAGQAFF